MKFQEVLSLLIGFMCGYLLFQLLNFRPEEFKVTNNEKNYSIRKNFDHEFKSKNSSELYDEEVAEKLINEVKILCWVFTHPANHKTKVPAVRGTWGRKCSKLLFMSIEKDPEHEDVISLPVANGREHLWNKTKLAMKYVEENYINSYDWFMRADDDK